MQNLPSSSVYISIDSAPLWKNYIENIKKLLTSYSSILDSYVLDFYVDDLWGALNPEWRISLESFSLSDLSNFLNYKSKISSSKVLPLSLIAFRASCFSFILPRVPTSDIYNQSVFSQSNRSENSTNIKSSGHHSTCNKNITEDSGKEVRLKHAFRKHLKPKKQHEVSRMAEVASQVFDVSKSDVLVDCGSGQGHLGRLVSYGYGIPVVCLEAQETLVDGARKFDSDLEKFFSKRSSNDIKDDKHLVGLKKGLRSPVHAPLTIRSWRNHDSFIQDLVSFVKFGSPSMESLIPESPPPWTVIGLHCCGDLSSEMIRMFSAVESCRGLVLVGCCYMKLSTDTSDECGFPMSDFVKSIGCSLSYVAREMACHAIENYSQKLMTKSNEMKVHAYRAALEELIIRRNPELNHSGLRPVKNAHLKSFKEYAFKATSRLENLNLDDSELDSQQVQNKLNRWIQVVAFYSIRLLLAPAVETLILLDRLMFLFEKGYQNASLFPIFEPDISPRNYVIQALKE